MVDFINALKMYDKEMGTKDSYDIPVKEVPKKIKDEDIVVDIEKDEEEEKARDEPKEEPVIEVEEIEEHNESEEV